MTSAHEARPSDPLLRWLVPAVEESSTLIAGTAVAWLGRASRRDERWVTALGEDPATVVQLVEELCRRNAVDGVTVPDTAFGHLPHELQSPDPGHWSLWTLEPDRVGDAATRAVSLAPDDPRIEPLLREHSETAHVFPGHPRIRQWAGIVEGDDLVSVAGRVQEPSGAAHLVSVCTDPRRRGAGLAGDVCRRLIRDAVDEGAPVIVLEMVASNDAARRTYTALGFEEVGRYRSGLLAHALPTLAP